MYTVFAAGVQPQTSYTQQALSDGSETSAMDEPFRKRPRLSMFTDESSDAVLDEDLGTLRYRNDKLLKSRFESIFQKYSRDFTGVGDEINLWTGEIEVNNGHLHGSRNETDTGAEDDSKGKSLLRAMTEAEGAEDEYFDNEGGDEVLQSIEEIAENAALSSDEEEDLHMNSDDELFAPVQSHSDLPIPEVPLRSSTIRSDAPDSDCDSLFEVCNPVRSDSPDSLFEARNPTRCDSPDSLFEVQQPEEDSACRDTTKSSLDSLAQDEEIDETLIMERFGPKMGGEVLAIVRQAQSTAVEAHIEPAWRIPVNAIPPKTTRSTSSSRTPSDSAPPLQETHEPPSPDHGTSLWKPSIPGKTARTKHLMRFRRTIRADSEDPLQQDFPGEDEAKSDGGDDPDWTLGEQGEEEDDDEYRDDTEFDIMNGRKRHLDEHVDLMKQGICSFCRRKFASRGGVFTHWRNLVRDSDKKGTDIDEVHDMHWIRGYRAESNTKTKRPRLAVCDFKAMVELHEGAGLSFAEIAKCKVLRTKKTGPVLNEVYDQFRTLPADRDLVDERGWTEKEFQILDELRQNPSHEVATFAKRLPGFSDTNIGNKLAEIWLKPFRDRREAAASQSRQQSGRRLHRQSSVEILEIKEEDSDDELFGTR
ncbi:hypothetical protein PV11_01505 [Exophiala sideris]|uniref:Uncharacterized protein n=1 Tax=Exophiala sideris TaxID=1016849 RepID=A0A0D1XD91_9EURO|nr:hypothetical protein PV11_01505 [Exophiala sideris]